MRRPAFRAYWIGLATTIFAGDHAVALEMRLPRTFRVNSFCQRWVKIAVTKTETFKYFIAGRGQVTRCDLIHLYRSQFDRFTFVNFVISYDCACGETRGSACYY